jgi:hypothetical protein
MYAFEARARNAGDVLDAADRRADVVGVSSEFMPPRRAGFLRRVEQPSVVLMKDLRNDPATSSETTKVFPKPGQLQTTPRAE